MTATFIGADAIFVCLAPSTVMLGGTLRSTEQF